MEEPDGEARGREDHAAVGRLGGEEGAVGGGGLALLAVPEIGGELGDGGKVCGGQERRLPTEEDGVRDNGGGSAAELVESAVNVSTPFEGRGQIGGEKESSMQEGSMNMAGEKHGSYHVESAEPSNLQTCHAPNGGVSNKTLFAPFSEVFSSDNSHMRYLLDKATEGSICEHGDLADSKDDLGGATDVKTNTEDLQMVCTKPHCDSEGLSDLHNDSERWPQVVDGVGFTIKGNNELKQVDLIPKIEAEVSRSVEDDSIPSFSGGIDDSLRKAGCACETLNDMGMSHMANGDLWCNVLYAPLSEGCQSKDARHIAVMGNKVTQGSQCGQEFGVQQPSYGMNVICSKTDPNHQLEKDELLTNTRGEFSSSIHEDSVPSISVSSVDFTFDGNAGQIGKTSEHRAIMEKVSHGSQRGGVLSCESRSLKESHADENQSSTLEVKTCEEGLQTGQVEPCHSIVALSDSGKYGTDILPRGGDGLRSMTGANHELVKDDFHPKSDVVVSCPVDEASIPSNYNSPIDVLLYKEDGLVGEISENRTGVEKLAHDLLGEVMLSFDSRPQTEASGDENQHFWMDVPKGSTASVCEVENTGTRRSCDPCAEIEFPLQQSREKHVISESPPERDLTSSSHNLPCENEPCCSGRETPAFCLGHQDSAGIGLESSDCLVQELNTCTSTDDKACSVDFVENGNGSHNQKEVPVIFFRRRNPVRAASSRNSNFEKCDQINKSGNSTRKSKKVDSVSSLLKSTMIKFPNKTTKGRSGINRPLNSSAWGSLQKLMDGFNQNCGPSTSRSHQTCLGKEISNRGSSEKKQLSIRKIRTSRCSKYKNTSLSDIGYLAGELNGQPTCSVRIDTNVSSDALFNSSNGAHKAAQCVEGNHTLKLTSSLTDIQQFGLENVTQETCPGYIHGECGTSTSERSLNNIVGFSPDSVLDIASVTCESNTSATLDVIVHENPSCPGGLIGGGLRASALSTSHCENHHASSLMDLEQQVKTVRENDMGKEDVIPSHAMMYNDIGEGKQTLAKSNTMRKGRNVGKQECRKKDGKKGKNINKNRSSTKISSSEASKLVSFSNDSPSLDPSELLLHTRPPKFGSCSKVVTSAIHDVGMHGYDNMCPFGIDNDDEGSAFDNVKSLRRKKKDSHGGKKGKVRDPHGKGRSKKKNIADNTYGDLIPAAELVFKNSSAVSVELPAVVACKTDGASVPPAPAWVCCDDCEKWRCIPTELADKISKENLRWTCKENEDKTFADCSIPQEKTDDEINAELGLSDASADEANGDGSNSKASGEPNFALLRSNLFLHRNRRTQSIDEFQRRTYAKLGKFHTGKKGYGLQLKEDVSEGRFLIEYVGEVLDITAYESRQRYYASKGQKHFYFMALNGGEVIDACTKGNLGRFINHSCSPNCRTEKWMVNGEVCIGIFAMRNIKKGEELTFDYNYVRVSGAAPQKCFCGTAKCRGYIGGDISGADMITQDDAEAGTFEPMADQEDAEEVLGANGLSSHGTHLDIVDHEASTKTEDSNDCPSVNPPELESEQQLQEPYLTQDATNGYLKLLLVTAAEGDNAGGTSKSVRDLSLILDALLKTRSNSVLLDIINKNGLQMLHNILKQNKSDFHRIPIIRKLVKVLEFLASKGILTSEHINGGPRCAGTESFRESMLGLLRHNDMQVQQIARNFRDRWIQWAPRNISRNEPTEYSRASISAHDIHVISTAGGSFPTSANTMDWKSIRRKRKSRWDYQPDDHYKMGGLKIQKVCPVQSEFRTGSVGNKLHGNWGTNSSHNDVPVVGSSADGADDEAPPGFESQQESRPGQACLESGVSPGLYLERYQHNLTISYGIPIAFVEHFGTPEVEGGPCRKNWKVAPGLQIETGEYIGIGEMGREQNFHTIIKDGDFLTIIKDFESCLLPPTSQEQGDPGPRGRE
ncbi:hypothetical protein OsI_07633 [Oryza sativa Indica Group]|uniref:Histone-lysine N-methyltransferase ASHH2 n=1 Tax=Oryza sativa subsp. indica TaxID=39946 RepID=B8AJE9_ORYSI|nr:hypothetical protein OsI_07633 [Oryza sativa Indica Group]